MTENKKSNLNPLVVVLGVSGLFFTIFMAVAVGTMMSFAPGRSEKKFFLKDKSGHLGVIEVNGAIMDSKKILAQVEKFSEDTKIKGVLVRVNSPGGAVAPSQEIYDAFKELGKKKPVYTSMSSLAASGGYYIACGTKKIFANPGTLTGSIGVIMQFADLSKLFQWAKFNPYNIKTGKFKDIGSPNREMTADEKELMQVMIDNVLAQFRRAVAQGRNLSMEKVIEVSDGRIFSGEQAKEAKLVDELGGMNDAIQALAKEAGIDGKPKLVYGAKKMRFIERLLSENTEDDDDADAESNSNYVGYLEGMQRIVGKAIGVSHDQRIQSNLMGPLFMLPQAVR